MSTYNKSVVEEFLLTHFIYSITNLQIWGESESIINKTLELFNELASGYSALKNLRKIESTSLIMQNHLSNDFSFFNGDKHCQSRMLYYQVLCKILFAEDNNEREFYEFMKPFEVRLDSLSLLDTIEEYRQPEVQVKSPLEKGLLRAGN